MIQSTPGGIPVTVERHLENYREVYLWIRLHSPTVRTLFVIYPVALVIAILFVGKPAWIVPVVLFGIIQTIRIFAGTRSLAKRAYDAHERNGAHVYEFGNDGYRLHTDHCDSNTVWTVVQRVVEIKLSFLLVYANTMFVLVPKSAIAPGDIAAFRAMLATR